MTAPIQVPGHYFGNKGLFAFNGKVLGSIITFFFGPIDFTIDPFIRNKVDYSARIFIPFFFVIFVLVYIFASVCPWAMDYNE